MLLTAVFVAIIGLLAGGVVNVLADDLPLRRPIRTPRYVTDEKKRSIHLPPNPDESIPMAQLDDEKRPLIAWLGVVAFLSHNRTSPSSTKLSWRYPLTEILTSTLMVIAVLATWDEPNVTFLQTIFLLAYMAIFVLITIIDIEHKLILYIVIVPSCLLAILDTILGEFTRMDQPHLKDALVGGVVGFVVFFLLYNGGFLFTYVMGKLRGQEINEIAFGYGDVMMATLSGLILGWQALIFAMFITVFLGAFGALIYIVSRQLLGARYSAYTALPYGPYIVIGTILMLLFPDQVGSFLGR